MNTIVLDDEDLATVEWLASLVKSQALSERDQGNRLYGAYADKRAFPGQMLDMARTKIARVERLQAALKENK
jgi:hypothetical protein